MRILNFTINGLLVLSLLVSGCSPKSEFAHTRKPGEPLLLTAPDMEVRKQVQHLLKEDDLLKAHRVLRNARVNGVKEKSIVDLYETLGNQLLIEAQKEEAASRFANAGKFYSLAMDMYSEDKAIKLKLMMPRIEAKERLEECADRLMKKGLAVYRAGNLVDATNIWKRIQEFYPEHGASQEAISTAEKQLENLEKLAPAKEM